MFQTVLIANRGEIACRVQRTLRQLGVRSVAVYSEAEPRARHVLEADQAVCVGGAAARDSYLNVKAILEAAVATLEPGGRVVGAANAALPGYQHPYARHLQAATTLREHRGGGHARGDELHRRHGLRRFALRLRFRLLRTDPCPLSSDP